MKTDTGTPGAGDSTMPPTADISAKTTDATIVATGEMKTRAPGCRRFVGAWLLALGVASKRRVEWRA